MQPTSKDTNNNNSYKIQNSNQAPSTTSSALPKEILQHIFSFLDPYDILSAMQVNKSWKSNVITQVKTDLTKRVVKATDILVDYLERFKDKYSKEITNLKPYLLDTYKFSNDQSILKLKCELNDSREFLISQLNEVEDRDIKDLPEIYSEVTSKMGIHDLYLKQVSSLSPIYKYFLKETERSSDLEKQGLFLQFGMILTIKENFIKALEMASLIQDHEYFSLVAYHYISMAISEKENFIDLVYEIQKKSSSDKDLIIYSKIEEALIDEYRNANDAIKKLVNIAETIKDDKLKSLALSNISKNFALNPIKVLEVVKKIPEGNLKDLTLLLMTLTIIMNLDCKYPLFELINMIKDDFTKYIVCSYLQQFQDNLNPNELNEIEKMLESLSEKIPGNTLDPVDLKKRAMNLNLWI